METFESGTKATNERTQTKSEGKAGKSEESFKFPHDGEKFLLSRLGETIQRKRLEIGLSQEQLCGLTDMNRTYLSDVERGVSNASFLVLWKIATALRCELWELVRDVDFSRPSER